MDDRTILNRGICIASALAVLVAVLTSPLRPSSSNGVLSGSDCLRRNFAIPPTRTDSSLKSVTLRTAPVKAVRSESEEETLSRAACPAWCSLDLPPSSSLKTQAPAPTAFGLTQASQPLRC